jgi:cytochrome P450
MTVRAEPSAGHPRDEVRVSTWEGVREALRRKELRQALYDEGAAVMADCLLVLHGEEHRRRRRLENRLFRREVFAHWEQEVLGATVEAAFAPFVADGRGDLVPIGYRTTVNLTAFIAGVDRPTGSAEETDRLLSIVRTFSEGATAVHSTRPRQELARELTEAMAAFEEEFYGPSLRRREALVQQARRTGDESGLTDDVLCTLLWNADRLELPPEVVRREVAFYLQAGSHSTANAFTHTADELFRWCRTHPGDLDRASGDRLFVQRCVHEALRLHPASPVAWRRAVGPVRLADGTELDADDLLVLDLAAANRSEEHFGPGADRFDPWRLPAPGVPAWGHSFGGGMHACVGMELDGGLECTVAGHRAGAAASEVPTPPEGHLHGTVAVMVAALLAHGGRPDPQRPPVQDPGTSRRHFSSYPVTFPGSGAAS